ncbi:MAG: hypothetical protein ACREJ4_06565 [Candidatus Methylomirabilaceae bacterium]
MRPPGLLAVALPLALQFYSPLGAQRLKVSIDLDDSTGVLQSAFASAFRSLGDINVVTTEEDPDFVLEGVALCSPSCADPLSYSLALRFYSPFQYTVARSIAEAWIPPNAQRRSARLDSLTSLIWSRIEGAELTHQSWVVDWGRDRYEQEVRELVREIDSGCLERHRAQRRALSSGARAQYDAYLAWSRSREWIC